MIVVISPAKSLDYSPQSFTKKHTEPIFLDDSQELISGLSKKTKSQVAKLMGISDKLAELNVQRYRDWCLPFTPENAKQAILAVSRDGYQLYAVFLSIVYLLKNHVTSEDNAQASLTRMSPTTTHRLL